MKIIKNLMLIIFTIYPIYGNQNQGNEINLLATYEEGFGVLMKRNLVLVKSPKLKNVKNQNNDAIYILVKNKANTTDQVFLPIHCSNKIRFELEELFKNSDSVAVTAVGMETIEASGVPGLSKSFRRDDLNEERFEHLELPGGPGWGVRNIFQIWWFEILK